MAAKTWLVTGGCGFIGSHLADALTAAGDRVRVLDDLSSGRRENIPANADFRQGDVAIASTVRSAMQGVSGCFHLAAIASVERCNQDWLGAHRVNVGGLINVLDAARRNATPVVYASSAAIYGSDGTIPLAENARANPTSPYAVDKFACELQAKVAARLFGVPSIGLRPFNVYGPRQNPHSPYSGVISIFAARILRGEAIALHGDGTQVRDFIHVRDVVRAFVAAMEVANATAGVYNVCTGHPTSLLQLVSCLEAIIDCPARILRLPSRVGDIRVSLGDPSQLNQLIGFANSVRLEAGLAELVQVFAADPSLRSGGRPL